MSSSYPGGLRTYWATREIHCPLGPSPSASSRTPMKGTSC